MAKKTPRAKAKEKAWKSFSIYIRTRDCLRFKGNVYEGLCVTCWREYPFKELQAGHFIDGRGDAVLFDERLVYSQCYGCNVGKKGHYVEYFVFMEREWGREKIDEFRALKHETRNFKEHHFLELKEEFDRKTKELLLDSLTPV